MTPRHHLRRAEGRDRRAPTPACRTQLQRIARFALEQPHDLALGTVAAVAEATEVQPSAMIRFANALGYRRLLARCSSCSASHLVERSAQLPRAHRADAPQQRNGAARAGRRAAPVRRRLDRRAAPARGARRARPTCTPRCSLLAGAPRIHVLAQRRAFPVACYLAYALSQLELRTHLLDGVGGMLRESAARASRRATCCWSASFRNYSPEVIEAAPTATRRGVAGDRHHRQPALAAEAGRRCLLRARRRLDPPVPLAGRAAVPGAGAGGQHRPPAGRAAARRPRRSGRARQRSARADERARRSTSSAWAAPRSTSTASRSAAGSRTCARFAKYLGGSPANTAVGVARLGPQAGDAHARRRRAQRPLRARDARRRRRRRRAT